MACNFYATKECNYIMIASSNMVKSIEFASRLCYDANDKMTDTSWKKYLSARIKSGHESIIEHGQINFIIDFTNGKSYFEDAAINKIEEHLSLSNSLLHYVKERGWNNLNRSSAIVIISGNVRMWRDFIKYLIRNGLYHSIDFDTTPVFRDIIVMFRYWDVMSCGGVFTIDIPELNINQEVVKRCGYFSIPEITNNETDGYGFNGDDSEDPDLVKTPTRETLQLIYIQHPPKVYEEFVFDNPDYGTTMRLLHLDNAGVSTLKIPMLIAKRYPYLRPFINEHTLDLNSVSYFIHMPRIVSQQEARHRINSISQRSQRYVNEDLKSEGFYVPESVKKAIFREDGSEVVLSRTGNEDEPGEIFRLSDIINISQAYYAFLVQLGVPKEDAREFLMGGVYTDMVVTKPFHTLPHYFKERCSERAQTEIREPAKALRNYLNSVYSHLFTDGRTLF